MSDSPDDPDPLAAEYVLGTLDTVTARQVAQRAETDPVLRAAISAWEDRLTPLASLVEPVTPPDAMWQRLSASIAFDPIAPVSATVLARAWRSVVVWRVTSGVGLALAASLALAVWLRPPPAQPVAALVPAGSEAAAYVAQLEPNGTLRVAALRAVPVAEGKDLELWALPEGAKRPIPLGVLPGSGIRVVPVGFPTKGTQLLISLEPKGGSPTGLPTGPVLFGGTLHGV
ncbi:MAG TPA: anti-sigma factor [Acetobacteraceae bacterium]|jgi:anti-sigma-K factor RskA